MAVNIKGWFLSHAGRVGKARGLIWVGAALRKNGGARGGKGRCPGFGLKGEGAGQAGGNDPSRING